ncbi:unnamed protein product [Rhodiola kirilowii]
MRMIKAVMCVLMLVLELGFARHSLLDLSSREELVELAGYGEEKLSTVLITGSVFSQDSIQLQPVSGAKVGVTCSPGRKKTRKSSWEEETVITDEFGDFTIDLPSHLHGTQNLDKACQVKIIHVPARGHYKRSFGRMEYKEIKLSSARNGVRIYTAGKIILQRLESEDGPSVAKLPIQLSTLIRYAKLPIHKWRG